MTNPLTPHGKQVHREHAQEERAHERVPHATWRDVRGVVFGTLLGVFLMNLAAWYFLAHHSPNRGPRVVKTKWQLIERGPRGTDWLILGDSSALRGVVPALLDERLGTRSVNLGTTRRMLVTSDAWMLERFIAQQGPPKGVLMVHVYEVWHGDRSWLISSMPDIPMGWGFWERMNLKLPLTPSEQYSVFLSRYVPLYSRNQTLATAIQYPWKAGRYFSSIGVDETGYMPIKRASPRQVEDDKQRNIEMVRGKRFEMSAINLQALERIRALAEQHGFDVYLANSPLYQGLYEDPEFFEYFQQVQAALREFAATSPWFHYIAQEPWTFPKEQMENCDHVTEPASRVYTEKLAEEIIEIQARRSAPASSSSSPIPAGTISASP